MSCIISSFVVRWEWTMGWLRGVDHTLSFKIGFMLGRWGSQPSCPCWLNRLDYALGFAEGQHKRMEELAAYD